MDKQGKSARIYSDITMTEQSLQQAIDRNDEPEIARQNAWLVFNKSKLATLNGDEGAVARFGV